MLLLSPSSTASTMLGTEILAAWGPRFCLVAGLRHVTALLSDCAGPGSLRLLESGCVSAVFLPVLAERTRAVGLHASFQDEVLLGGRCHSTAVPHTKTSLC